MSRASVLLDAAAAPLDARCLQTFANTRDCAARCACNDASNKHHGNITLILSSDLAIRAEPLQPPLRCPQRHPKRLSDLLAAEAFFQCEEFTCISHHSRDENAYKHLDVRQMWLWCIDWCHESVMCVSRRKVQNLLFYRILKRVHFSSKGAQNCKKNMTVSGPLCPRFQ